VTPLELPLPDDAPDPYLQLDAQEIEPDNQQTDGPGWQTDPLSDAQAFRHSGWQADRYRVYRALRRTNASLSRLLNFRACGQDAWLVESLEQPGHYAVHATHCHDRLCLPCGQARSRTIAANVKDALKDRPYRCLTLTVKHRDVPLSHQLDHLLNSFRRLRAQAFWKKTQKGGVAFLEIKWNEPANHWHPHLHIILDGSYVDKRHVSKQWFKATKDSSIIRIALIRDHEKAVSYVCKYASKPIEHALYRTPDRLDEAIEALHGRRLVFTFGTWRGVRLRDLPPRGEWRRVAKLDELLTLARRGDPDAVAIANRLKERTSCQPLDFPLLANPPPTAHGTFRSGWSDRRCVPDAAGPSTPETSRCSTTPPSAAPASGTSRTLWPDALTSFE